MPRMRLAPTGARAGIALRPVGDWAAVDFSVSALVVLDSVGVSSHLFRVIERPDQLGWLSFGAALLALGLTVRLFATLACLARGTRCQGPRYVSRGPVDGDSGSYRAVEWRAVHFRGHESWRLVLYLCFQFPSRASVQDSSSRWLPVSGPSPAAYSFSWFQSSTRACRFGSGCARRLGWMRSRSLGPGQLEAVGNRSC